MHTDRITDTDLRPLRPRYDADAARDAQEFDDHMDMLDASASRIVAPADGSFVCMCVDPAVAAEYGSWPFVSERDIAATDAQWAALDGTVAALRGRCVSAYGADDGSWRFTIVDDAGRDGAYGRIFDRLADVTIAPNGDPDVIPGYAALRAARRDVRGL